MTARAAARRPMTRLFDASIVGSADQALDFILLHMWVFKLTLHPQAKLEQASAGSRRAMQERMTFECRPQLVLCDLHIGAESGYDLLARLRAHAGLAHTPFVFLSSTAMQYGHHLKRSRELGACDFIQRPIEPEAFLARIGACMKKGPDPFFPKKGPDPF